MKEASHQLLLHFTELQKSDRSCFQLNTGITNVRGIALAEANESSAFSLDHCVENQRLLALFLRKNC